MYAVPHSWSLALGFWENMWRTTCWLNNHKILGISCMLGCWHMLAKASHHWVVLTFADICGQSILSACGSSRSREPREKVLLLVYRWWSIPKRYLFRDVYTIYICDMMYMYIYIYEVYQTYIHIYMIVFRFLPPFTCNSSQPGPSRKARRLAWRYGCGDTWLYCDSARCWCNYFFKHIYLG